MCTYDYDCDGHIYGIDILHSHVFPKLHSCSDVPVVPKRLVFLSFQSYIHVPVIPKLYLFSYCS